MSKLKYIIATLFIISFVNHNSFGQKSNIDQWISYCSYVTEFGKQKNMIMEKGIQNKLVMTYSVFRTYAQKRDNNIRVILLNALKGDTSSVSSVKKLSYKDAENVLITLRNFLISLKVHIEKANQKDTNKKSSLIEIHGNYQVKNSNQKISRIIHKHQFSNCIRNTATDQDDWRRTM